MLSARFRAGILLAAAMIAGLSLRASGIVSAQNSGVPTINLSAGAFFEILAETDLQESSVSYVLTREREFLSASRDPLFSYRFVEPGTYFLTGELVSADGSESHRRDIQIQVVPTEGGLDHMIQESSASQQPGAIVDTLPLQSEVGAVVLEEHGLIRIQPVIRELRSLSLDLNPNVDRNGDSDPANDDDSAGTEFQNASQALYLWFVNVITPRVLYITAVRTDDQIAQQSLYLLKEGQSVPTESETIPTPEEPVVSAGSIVIEMQDEGSVRFSVSLTEPLPDDAPLLYEWDFGDGTRSMLDHPLHTYSAPGTFAVTVRIVDLRNFEERVKLISSVEITSAAPPSNEPDKPQNTGSKSGGGFLGIIVTVLKIFSVLIVCVIIGAAITFAASKLRGRKLSDRLEAAEKKIVGESHDAIEEAPPPMEIAAVETPEIVEDLPPPPEPEPESEPEPQPEPQPEPESVPDSSTLPEWLQTGEAMKPEETSIAPPPPPAAPPSVPTTPPPTPKEPPTPPSEPPAENVSHDAFSPTPSELTVDETSAPAWLSQGLEKAKVTEEIPATGPVTLPAPPPEPQPEPPAPPPPPSPTQGTGDRQQATGDQPPSVQPHPSVSADLTPEEKEQMKKRRKRQRYRENVRKRQTENTSPEDTQPHPSVGAESDAQSDAVGDEPVAFIRAEALDAESPPMPPTDAPTLNPAP